MLINFTIFPVTESSAFPYLEDPGLLSASAGYTLDSCELVALLLLPMVHSRCPSSFRDERLLQAHTPGPGQTRASKGVHRSTTYCIIAACCCLLHLPNMNFETCATGLLGVAAGTVLVAGGMANEDFASGDD